MIRWTEEMEENYNIAIEDDGNYIYCYNSEFYDFGRIKFHCAVINITMDKVQIEYNHTLSDHKYGFGVTASVNGLKEFTNKTISQHCNLHSGGKKTIKNFFCECGKIY